MHVFHTRRVEREIRNLRRRDGPTVTIKCPCCESTVIVSNIPGFEGVRLIPAPQLHDYLQRRVRNRRPVYSTMDELAGHILRISYPPYFPPENWSTVVEYIRSLDRCTVRDDAAIPVLSRDPEFQCALERWAAEVHWQRTGSHVQALPLPDGQGVTREAAPRSPVPTTLREVSIGTASVIQRYISVTCRAI